MLTILAAFVVGAAVTYHGARLLALARHYRRAELVAAEPEAVTPRNPWPRIPAVAAGPRPFDRERVPTC